MSTKSKKARGATKGTTLKYSKVVGVLRGITKPTKINSTTYAKEHNVSTNLILALIQMGYLKKQDNGYVWDPSMKGTDMEIAEKARVMANQWTNKRKPTRQRPTGKRSYKGRKSSKTGKRTVAKKAAKKQAKKTEAPVQKRQYTKRDKTVSPARRERQPVIPTGDEADKLALARAFSKRGLYKDALALLD